MRLLELQTFFDAAFVTGVEDYLFIPRQGVVGFQNGDRVGIGHLLDGDDDLHK